MTSEPSDGPGPMGRFFHWVKATYGRWAVAVGAALLLAVAIIVTWVLDPEPVALSEGVSRYGGAADAFRSLLWISLATGLIAMALAQTSKYVFNIRGKFHRSELQQYFEGVEDPKTPTPYSQLKKAINETTWGEHFEKRNERERTGARSQRHTLYVWSLPLEQLAGQLAAAGEVAIMEDTRLRLQPAAAPQGPAESGRERAEPTPLPREYGLLLSKLSGQTVAELDDAVRKSRTRRVDASSDPESAESLVEGIVSAELAQRVQRGIDIIQIVIGHRWRWLVRATTMFLCAPIAWVVVSFTDTDGSAHVLATLVATVLGGYLAWFARDIAAAVEARRG